jgi:4-amino-4-deoxy-L-arabinose transferase-like glycosyltransferase
VQRNALPIVWLALLIIYILGGTHLVPFHGDEATQIYMSRDYGYQFILRDLELLRYSQTPASATQQELRLLNGTLNKYLVGLAWHLRGFSLDDLNEQWDWGADWDYNVQNGHRPSEALLQTARWPSALFLAAGAVVMFLLGQAVGGRPAAYTASLYYAINPALLINGRRAMMEGSFIFFILLTVLTACWLLLRPSWRSALALGVVSGLALASKHTAVFTVVAVFITCAVYVFARTIRTWRAIPVHIVLRLLLAAFIALLVFYALNPAWWGDPLGRVGTVLQLRQSLLAGQSAAFGAYPDFGAQISGYLRQTLLDLPQYAEVPGWLEHLSTQIAAYEASIWRGLSVGGSDFGAAVLAVMIATGVWAVLRFKRIRAAVRTLIGVWVLVMALTTLLLTPLEWQRYYLSVYPAVGLLVGLGVSRLMAALNRANRKNPAGNNAQR